MSRYYETRAVAHLIMPGWVWAVAACTGQKVPNRGVTTEASRPVCQNCVRTVGMLIAAQAEVAA